PRPHSRRRRELPLLSAMTRSTARRPHVPSPAKRPSAQRASTKPKPCEVQKDCASRSAFVQCIGRPSYYPLGLLLPPRQQPPPGTPPGPVSLPHVAGAASQSPPAAPEGQPSDNPVCLGRRPTLGRFLPSRLVPADSAGQAPDSPAPQRTWHSALG